MQKYVEICVLLVVLVTCVLVMVYVIMECVIVMKIGLIMVYYNVAGHVQKMKRVYVQVMGHVNYLVIHRVVCVVLDGVDLNVK